MILYLKMSEFFYWNCIIILLTSPLGSSVHEILQARILVWIVILFYRKSSQPRDQTWVFFTIWATREAQK